MSAISVVPRMNPSTASKARRAMASMVAPALPGAMAYASPRAWSESRRKKKVSSSASTLVAMSVPIRLSPLSSPPAAFAPNLPSRLLALSAMLVMPSPVATPKWSAIHFPASFSDATIWSPVSMSAVMTMYAAPPTTATSTAQVSPAASDLFSRIRTSHRWTGPRSAVPSRASITGVTAVLSVTQSQTPTAATPVTSSATTHQAASRRAWAGRSGFWVCTPPADHGSPATARSPGPGGWLGESPPNHNPRMHYIPCTAGTVPSRPRWKSSKACFSSASLFMTNGP